MNIFEKLINTKNFKSTGLYNLNASFFALYLNKLLQQEQRSILVVTSNLYEANKIYDILLNYTNPLIYQADDITTSEALSSSPELKLERLNTLKELSENTAKIVLTDINGYLKKIPSKETFLNNMLKISEGNNINQELLIKKLIDFGYNRESLVNNPGDIAIRGFIVDVFPINSDFPVRIEFFGNNIDHIKTFSLDDQRTIEKIKEIKIYSFAEKNYETNILSYLDNPIVVFKDYEQIKIAYQRILNDIVEFNISNYKKYLYDLNDINYNDFIHYFDFDSTVVGLNIKQNIDFNVKEIEKFNENIDKINKYLINNLETKKTIILCLQMKYLKNFLASLTVPYILTNEENIIENKINIIDKNITYGFSKDNYIFITEYELFNRTNVKKYKKFNYKYASKIKDINKLEVGDYVVHTTHGIGIYNGIKTLPKNGLLNDYLEICYAKNDKLYIPASKIELISKYSSKEGYAPKINSLNSISWFKTKEHVKTKIRYEAERLLKVQAERNLKRGFSFSKDTPMQIMFENEFEYETTSDQLKVVEEIKKEMESIVPMDHILCGDVGYGKTEVAFRVMFKAVQDSKQVLYLCPTTLLSKQQYDSAKKRFADFPVNIELLNRFVTDKKAKQILQDLSLGKIDILIGTHRILSNDVILKDLGLLVVDEEQRFGVSHKEKIKEIKSNIDILTLTATPIPRTLQMSILGLKSLSLIETPPKNRHAVQTYVIYEDNKIIRDIIYKELSRNGQIFILYNKVANIEEQSRKIKLLVPDAKVICAHGQMPKQQLEDIMMSFVEGAYNVLVCTTIIETGIDIPNVNSLIIIDADKFGLAQLYQIRGRVGRSDRIAYAYLMYNKNKQLSEVAIKRLKVIKEFTELGSGFQIAARDLSIRGAGDILGALQAGFIDDIGIDLYMKLLENEILKLKGEKVVEDLDNENEIINVSNHIKDSYVSDKELKIEIHKLINTIKTEKDLINVKQELEDRFGKIDKDMEIYMNEELFENLLKKQGVFQVIDNNNYIEIIFDKNKSDVIDYQNLFVKSIDISNNFKFEYKNDRLHIKILKKDLIDHPLVYLNKLLQKM